MTAANAHKRGYKHTPVGWIPEEWQHDSLDSFGRWCGGGTPSKDVPEFWTNGTIPWVSSQEMKSSVLYDTTYMITDDAIKNSSAKIVPIGTLLFVTRSGILRHTFPVAMTGVELAINQDIKALIPNKAIDKQFLFQAILFRGKDILRKCSKVGTTVESVEYDLLRAYEIPLPPIPEQTKIAEILSAWDKAIEQVRALIEQKKLLKQGLMQQLLTGRMRFPQFGKPAKNGKLPEGWKEVKAGDLFSRRSTKNHGNEPVLSVTQDQGVVYRDTMERKINMSHENTGGYKLVNKDDFIISLRSFQGGIEYSAIRGIVSPAYHVIYAKNKINHGYYRLYFKSRRFIDRMAVTIIGIRDGKQVNYDDFAFLKMHYPPIEEQTRISGAVNALENEIEILDDKLTLLKEQKRGLMQKLLTGEVRVKV